VEDLADYVPHRPPMLWIDEVLEVSEDGLSGKCALTVKEDALHQQSGVKKFAPLEWIAQAYAFISAHSMKGRGEKPRAAEMFLAAMTDVRLTDRERKTGERFEILVRRTHSVGPFSLLEGQVFDATGESIAQAQLKVYCQY
jgi:predicted hotdog family 3-hydroxylacyl-ACP dehydratase